MRHALIFTLTLLITALLPPAVLLFPVWCMLLAWGMR